MTELYDTQIVTTAGQYEPRYAISEEEYGTAAAIAALPMLRQIKEWADELVPMADFASATTFDIEDGVPSTWGVKPSMSWGYTQGLIRPSYTACAYVNEQQLRMIRSVSRAFCIMNPSWMAVRENKINYAVGTGHVWTVQAREVGDKLDDKLKRKVSREITDFCRVNRYRQRQGEKLTRYDRDGEYLLQYYDTKDDGILRVRFKEPLLLRDPPGYGPEGNVWFGIRFEEDDYETPLQYYFCPANYDGGTLDGNRMAAWRHGVAPEDVQHRKANVDCSSPRGLPTTYCLRDPCQQALSINTAMARMVDVRARVAMIQRQVNGTISVVSAMLDRNRGRSGGSAMLPNVNQIPYGTVYQTNDQRQYEFPAQNLETDKIVHGYKSQLASVTSALGLADFVLAADAGHAFAGALVKEAPMNKSISRIQADLVEDDTEVFERAIQTAADHGRLPKSVLEYCDKAMKGKKK